MSMSFGPFDQINSRKSKTDRLNKQRLHRKNRNAAGFCAECPTHDLQPLFTKTLCRFHAERMNERTSQLKKEKRRLSGCSEFRGPLPTTEEAILNDIFITALRKFIQVRNITLPR